MTEHDAFTEDEIAAFATKLHEWGGSLPDRERALLRSLLLQAEGSEVAAFDSTRFPGSTLSTGTSLPSLRDATYGTLSPLANVQQPWILAAYDDRWGPING